MATEPRNPEIRGVLAGETGFAHEAMRTLRGSYKDEGEFVRHVDEKQRPEGYRLVGAFVSGREQAVAIAGFRFARSVPGS